MEHLVYGLAVALVCGLVIAILYRLTFTGASYSISYVRSLVAFAMITTIVIMVIGNNLARAFGLVGSMSIIRFRMAIKDTRDIVFIFLSLAVGMAAGTGQYAAAIAGTLFIGTVLYVLTGMNFGSFNRREYLLQFHFSSPDESATPYLPVINAICSKAKLINVRSLGDNGTFEISYYVTMRNTGRSGELIHRLNDTEGVSAVNLFFDEE